MFMGGDEVENLRDEGDERVTNMNTEIQEN